MALDMQSIYILASGGSRAMEQLDTTSNNLANVNTDGFKKMVIKEMSQRLDDNGGDANHLFVFPRFERSMLDLSQGQLKETHRPLDMAIEGNAFFVVQKGDEQMLTRSGHFFMDTDGKLLDRNGNAVLSAQDKPIILDPAKPFVVAPDGKILQEGEEVARLKLQAPSDVEAVGDTYYRAKGEAKQLQAKVHQGFLEMANVNPILEMTALIDAQRKFEIYGNLIKSIDQINSKTNEIGKA